LPWPRRFPDGTPPLRVPSERGQGVTQRRPGSAMEPGATHAPAGGQPAAPQCRLASQLLGLRGADCPAPWAGHGSPRRSPTGITAHVPGQVTQSRAGGAPCPAVPLSHGGKPSRMPRGAAAPRATIRSPGGEVPVSRHSPPYKGKSFFVATCPDPRPWIWDVRPSGVRTPREPGASAHRAASSRPRRQACALPVSSAGHRGRGRQACCFPAGPQQNRILPQPRGQAVRRAHSPCPILDIGDEAVRRAASPRVQSLSSPAHAVLSADPSGVRLPRVS
jgi:hypothetical protein